jgi:hypothetical protein
VPPGKGRDVAVGEILAGVDNACKATSSFIFAFVRGEDRDVRVGSETAVTCGGAALDRSMVSPNEERDGVERVGSVAGTGVGDGAGTVAVILATI